MDFFKVHIAKTGGTALRRCAPHGSAPEGKREAHHAIASHCTTKGAWHLPPRLYPAAWRATMASWPTFCVVRHPYERWLSLYRHEAHGKWRESFWRDLFHRDGRAEPGFDVALTLNASVFRVWSEAKLGALEALAAAPPSRACDVADPYMRLSCADDDCHSLAQSAAVFDADGERACTHVVRYATLFGELQRLKRAYGEALVGRGAFNCLEPTKRGHREPRDVVPLDGERLHGADIPPDLRRRIERVYALDFEAFRFCTIDDDAPDGGAP